MKEKFKELFYIIIKNHKNIKFKIFTMAKFKKNILILKLLIIYKVI